MLSQIQKLCAGSLHDKKDQEVILLFPSFLLQQLDL